MRIEECPVKTALDVIGGKWKPLILFELNDGPVRFGQLRRALAGVRHKVLTEQLRQLEEEGIVSRTVFTGKILQTEYRLSDYGNSLQGILAALALWGMEHRERRKNSNEDGTVLTASRMD